MEERRENDRRIAHMEQFLKDELGYKDLKPGAVHTRLEQLFRRFEVMGTKRPKITLADVQVGSLKTLMAIFGGAAMFASFIMGGVTYIMDLRHPSKTEFNELHEEVRIISNDNRVTKERVKYIADIFKDYEKTRVGE